VNFGRVLGPAFAALLMSFWVVILARLDLHIHEFGRLPLYALGIILTFNLGRDITLITLYPFCFGAGLVWWLERKHAKALRQPKRRVLPKISRTGLKSGKIAVRPGRRRRRFVSHRVVQS
jgi:hypothetical protein